MSEHRFFYTDLLAATWMAKHFGMLFEKHQSGAVSSIWYLMMDWNQDKYYIHPESLRLLEPEVGDAIIWRNPKAIDNDWRWTIMDARPVSTDNQYRIIQRDGKPFHWPLCEAA